MKYGVIAGRFQPFHKHHLRYALAAMQNCEHLIIGITNPDRFSTMENSSDLNRSRESSNPLNYFERLSIIRESLVDSGINLEKFSIVPFPINRPKDIPQYIPISATCFLTIYDKWGEEKKKTLDSLGLHTVVLWNKKDSEKGINASQIRKNILLKNDWEQDVTPAAARLIKLMKLDEKIRSILLKSLNDGELK